MVGLGAGVEFVVGAGVDVSSAGRSSSSKAVGSPWETTTKANDNKRNGQRMAQGSLRMLMVNFRMQFNFQALHCRAHHGRHQSKRLR